MALILLLSIYCNIFILGKTNYKSILIEYALS